MNERDFKYVPYIVYESMLAKEERQQKRLVIALIVLIIALFLSNALWLYWWNQYDYVDELTIEAEQDGSGNNVISGGNISYESTCESDKKTQSGT